MTSKKQPIIDADGHVIEPKDLWVKRVPPAFRDRTIAVVWDMESQMETTLLEGKAVQRASVLNGMARQPESKRIDPQGVRWEDQALAGRDAKARVEELDREVIDVAVLYPSLGLVLGGIKDPRHAVAACRIYNDWLAEFCAMAPDRLVGIAALPFQDPSACVLEARRSVETLGMHGVFVRPNAYNGRFLHDRVFDPVWETLEGLGVPVGLHPSGTTETAGAPQFYKPIWGPEFSPIGKPMHFLVDNLMALSMMMGTGVLERFPKLKVVVLESGGGWLPHWMDVMDHWVEVVATRAKFLSLTPSEYIQRQVWVSFDPDERTLPMVTKFLGADHLIWASDFPHHDVTAPSVTEELRSHLKGVSRLTQAKIWGTNAQQLYSL